MMIEKDKEEQKKEEDQNTESNPIEKSEGQIIAELRLALAEEVAKNSDKPSGLEDLTAAIKSGFSGNNQNNSGAQISFEHSYADQAMLDPDDVLDEKDMITFVAHRMLYIIADDKRNGQNIKAPFGLIIFKHNSTRLVKSGKETDQFNISTYTCRSKKELKWIRDHSLFGVMFFDKISAAISSDAHKASLLAKHVLSLRSIGQNQLVQMAKSRNIPVVEDLNYLRSMIAQSSAEQEMLRIEKKTKEMFVDQEFEAKQVGKEVMG